MSVVDRSTVIDAPTALDAVVQGIALATRASGQVALSYLNDAFTRLTGYDRAELMHSGLRLLSGPDGASAVQDHLLEAIGTGEDFSADWLIHCRDGRQLWTRVSARAADSKHAVITLEDIAEFKSTRESLRASEARLELAMEASELSMWDWNVAQDVVSYNEQWRISLGIDPQQLLKREALSERLMLPAEESAVLDKFERHFNGGTTHFQSEYKLATHDGTAKWFSAHAKVVRRDAHGKPARVIGVLQDISRSKQDQRTALEVEQRWERAIRGTSDGLYEWDLLTGHVWYASRFRDIIGCGDVNFANTFQAFQNVLHADDRIAVLTKIRAHLENQSRLDTRCRVVTRQGNIVWCRLRGDAERDASGRPTRLAGSLSDISAQIDAEKALSRSQDFYGTVLDSLPLFVGYADRDERILYANRMFQQFFATPLADSRGRVIKDVIGDRRYGAIGPYVRDALRGKTLEGQGRYRDAEGKQIDLEAAFIPHYDDDGEIQGCFVAARDITEKRLLEAELRQSQKMEAVGRLTGGIAHDFNNLLSVILGNMQLLTRSLQQTPRLLRQAETALNAALRGGELIKRLLAFARQQVLEPKIVDLNGLIGGMYELLRRSLTGDIDIQRQLAAETWFTRADPGQLENAVLNLVINARDAMPGGGVITIATRNVTIGADRGQREDGLTPGEYALVEVADNGAGMSAETLKRVFEPFFTTKEVGKGSGLGLSMVYGFVKQSGGHVHIASIPQQGTTVQLYFPRSQAGVDEVRPDGTAPTESPRGSETVLVVEDNAEVRGTTVEILTSLGYRVLEAANGHQALERFMRHPDIALVFTDIMLPGGLLGTQLVEKLTERRAELKVLLTSGFSDSTLMHRSVLDGSVELLPKPYQLEELARRVRALLDGNEENKRVPA
ncbi:PAS domain-containing sensor histidine kinase [Steroidobacter sp.]|uniref:hybrid sensor histidine kinase/response regulator n=1 Tax=Steroidobacter sp. TaxID=1978227 RepID=UPI001A56E051|nr:PAS domain-containing protein [Steroidobacter sp.]MBL8269025.1 PAS domain-containing protein [Steroidobacter sp.]